MAHDIVRFGLQDYFCLLKWKKNYVQYTHTSGLKDSSHLHHSHSMGTASLSQFWNKSLCGRTLRIWNSHQHSQSEFPVHAIHQPGFQFPVTVTSRLGHGSTIFQILLATENLISHWFAHLPLYLWQIYSLKWSDSSWAFCDQFLFSFSSLLIIYNSNTYFCFHILKCLSSHLKKSIFTVTVLIDYTFELYFLLFFKDFTLERHTKRGGETHTGRERSRCPAGSLMWDTIPGPRSRSEPEACPTDEPPRHPVPSFYLICSILQNFRFYWQRLFTQFIWFSLENLKIITPPWWIFLKILI